MNTIQPQIHAIDKYILRVYKRSKDLSIKDIINSYGLLMYFTLKPFESDMIVFLGSRLATLLTQKNDYSLYKSEGLLLFFTEQRHLAYSLVDLTTDKVSHPQTDEKAYMVTGLVQNICSRSGIEAYLAKLFSKQLTNKEDFETATGKLFRKNAVKENWAERKLLQGIWKEILSMDETDITVIGRDLYNATKTGYDGLDIDIPEKERLDYELTSILPDYFFHIDSENADFSIKDLINFYGVASFICYKRVLPYPYLTLGYAFATFAKEATGKCKGWQQNKCITSYSTRTDLVADFVKAVFCKTFEHINLGSDNALILLKTFITVLNWIKVKPEILIHLSKQQGTGQKWEQITTELLLSGKSKSCRRDGIQAANHLAEEVASFTSKELKDIRSTIYKKACITFLELQNHYTEFVNPLMR